MFSCTCALLHSVPTRFGTVTMVPLRSSPSVAMPRKWSGTQTRKKVAKPDEVDLQQMSIFDTVNEDDIIKEIMELEVNRMSPLDALNTLDKLQAKLKNRWMHQ